jgi:hypothetical protein
MKVIWTKHAEERQKDWEKKLGITREEVEVLVNNPEQIVRGDMDIVVAQTRTRNGLLRVPCIETGGIRKIVTLYWMGKTEKYWRQKK